MIADISNTKLKSHQSYSNLPYYTTSRLHFSFAVYYFLSLYNNTNNDIKRSSNMYLGPYQTSMVHIYENSQTIKVNSLNSLSANFTKWSNTLKQFVGNLPTNCLSLFGHFVGLALKGLTSIPFFDVSFCFVFLLMTNIFSLNLWSVFFLI